MYAVILILLLPVLLAAGGVRHAPHNNWRALAGPGRPFPMRHPQLLGTVFAVLRAEFERYIGERMSRVAVFKSR